VPAKSHAVIDKAFDRNPELPMSSTFYVNENGTSTGTGPFLYLNSAPFIAVSDTFKTKILGDDPDLVLIAEIPGPSQGGAMRDDMREFHEGASSVSCLVKT